MMKNWMRAMALALCLVLIFPAALAQEVAYTVDEPTARIFGEALNAGKMITGSVKLDLELDTALFASTEEESAQMNAVMDVIRQAELTFGAGKIDGGVRVEIGGGVTDAAGANAVGVEAALEASLDGLALESDLIAGKRLSAKWETILALCGMDETEITMIMSLKDVDAEEVLAQLAAEIEPMITLAAQVAEPYAQTVLTFIEGLPIEARENLEEEDYPPTALEVSVTFTAQDIGTLIGLLCDQAEQDATLMAIVDALLAQTGEEIDAAQLLGELRAAAAQMTNTDFPMTVYLGVNENGIPLYLEGYLYKEPTGESIYGGVFCYEDAELGWLAEILFGVYDAESNPMATAYMGGTYLGDPADPNVYAIDFMTSIYEGDAPIIDLQMVFGSEKAADSELPAYDNYTGYSVYMDDGEGGMQIVSNGEGRQGLTEAGGEYLSTTATTDTYYGDAQLTDIVSAEYLVEPTADGGLTGYYRVSESLPSSGVEKADIEVILSSEEHDPAASAALVQIALETVTNDEMDALMAEAAAALYEQKLPQLMKILPQEIIDMMAEEDAE